MNALLVSHPCETLGVHFRHPCLACPSRCTEHFHPHNHCKRTIIPLLRSKLASLEKGWASISQSSRTNYGGDCNCLEVVFLIALVLSLVNIDRCIYSNSEPEKCYPTKRTIGSLPKVIFCCWAKPSQLLRDCYTTPCPSPPLFKITATGKARMLVTVAQSRYARMHIVSHTKSLHDAVTKNGWQCTDAATTNDRKGSHIFPCLFLIYIISLPLTLPK